MNGTPFGSTRQNVGIDTSRLKTSFAVTGEVVVSAAAAVPLCKVDDPSPATTEEANIEIDRLRSGSTLDGCLLHSLSDPSDFLEDLRAEEDRDEHEGDDDECFTIFHK